MVAPKHTTIALALASSAFASTCQTFWDCPAPGAYTCTNGECVQKFLSKEARRLTSCEGDPFVVQAGDSCSTYENMCAGWTSVQCKGVGTTCANGNDQLWAGDTCTFSYNGAAIGRGLASSSPEEWCTDQGGSYSPEGGCYMPEATCYSIQKSTARLEDAAAFCQWPTCSSDSDCAGNTPCNSAIGQCAIIYCARQSSGDYEGWAEVEC